MGLDLQGGVEWLYKIRTDEIPKADQRDITQTTIDVIRRRVDPAGRLELDIRPRGKNRFYIQVPGKTSEEARRIEEKMQSAGKLVFCQVSSEETQKRQALGGEIVPGHRPFVARSEKDRTGRTVKRWYPVTFRELARLYSEKAYHVEDPLWWLLVKNKAEVTGEHLADVYPTSDDMGMRAIGFRFYGAGAKKFAYVTAKFAKTNEALAVILDNILYSAPRVTSRIAGPGIITGDFSADEQNDLIDILLAGSLPADIELEWKNYVGPALGEDSIRQGIKAAVIGIALVLIFMAIYYLFAGSVANFALLLNLLFVVGALSIMQVALTLPGIAALILTVGMSVDANVLIFERIREEKERGKTLRLAVRSGYERAFRTIVDANVTTLLAAMVLAIIGTGPIKGFAITLSIGIISSMFCALVVTRSIFEFLIERGLLKNLFMFRLVSEPKIRFSRIRHLALFCSVALIVLGLTIFVTRGDRKYDTDLTGGTRIDMELGVPLPTDEVRSRLSDIGYADAEVQSLEAAEQEGGVKGSRRFSIRVKKLSSERQQEKLLSDVSLAMKQAGLYDRVELVAANNLALTLSNPATEGRIRVALRDVGYTAADISRIVAEGVVGREFQVVPKSSSEEEKGKDVSTTILHTLKSILEHKEVGFTVGSEPLREMVPGKKPGQTEERTAVLMELLEFASRRGIREALIFDIIGQDVEALDVHGVAEDSGAEVIRHAKVYAPEDVLQTIVSSEKRTLNVPTFKREPKGGLRFTTEAPHSEEEIRERLGESLLSGILRIVAIDAPATRFSVQTTDTLRSSKIQEKIRDDITNIFSEEIAREGMEVRLEQLPKFPDFVEYADELHDSGFICAVLRLETPEMLQVVREQLARAGYEEALLLSGNYSSLARDEVDEVYLKLKADDLDSVREKLADTFEHPDPFRRVETIGTKVAGELKEKAFLALFVALVAIVFYIWFRFGEVKFGIAAIAALAHDVLMVMGGVAIADALSTTPVGEALMFKDIKINMQMIAAFLTIIGYSLNDTIVVFDRIRENMGGSRTHISPEIVDRSVNQTLGRTLLTSLTTLMVVVVLYLVGGPVIHGFAFALLLGVLVGTYSSVFIASPILIDWEPAMNIVGRVFRRSSK